MTTRTRRRQSWAWYHGGSRVTDWARMVWDRDRTQRDLNAEGPGMYWTSSFDEAKSYAPPGGVVYRGALKPRFKKLPKKKASITMLSALYEQAPREDREMFLADWGQEQESSRAIDHALRPYLQYPTLHESFTILYGDLFHHDASAYVKGLVALGFDGVVVPKGSTARRPTTGGYGDRKHLILWNLKAMEIE